MGALGPWDRALSSSVKRSVSTRYGFISGASGDRFVDDVPSRESSGARQLAFSGNVGENVRSSGNNHLCCIFLRMDIIFK